MIHTYMPTVFFDELNTSLRMLGEIEHILIICCYKFYASYFPRKRLNLLLIFVNINLMNNNLLNVFLVLR